MKDGETVADQGLVTAERRATSKLMMDDQLYVNWGTVHQSFQKTRSGGGGEVWTKPVPFSRMGHRKAQPQVVKIWSALFVSYVTGRVSLVGRPETKLGS